MENSVFQYYGGASIATASVLIDGVIITLVETNLPYQIVTNLTSSEALVRSQGNEEGPAFRYSIDLTNNVFNPHPILYLGEGTSTDSKGTYTQGLESNPDVIEPSAAILTRTLGLNWPWIQPLAYRGKRDSEVILSNFQAYQRLFAQYAQILTQIEFSTEGLIPSDDVMRQIGYSRRILAFNSQLRRKDPILLGWY